MEGPGLSLAWRAAGVVAMVYAHFLIFAQFAWVGGPWPGGMTPAFKTGGGNNLYGEALAARLKEGGPGLGAFVLMQRILPPPKK